MSKLEIKDAPPTSTDISMEFIDPTPDIHNLFLVFDILKQVFNDQHFYSKLDRVTVSWSVKMKLCAGLCQFDGRFCQIRLSEPLLKFRPRSDLINTLLVKWNIKLA